VVCLKKLLLIFICLILPARPAVCAAAADLSAIPEEEKIAMIAELTDSVQRMQAELLNMDTEIRRCDRSKKGWKTATIAGGLGVIGTGVGVIVQSAQTSKAKKDGKTSQKTEETVTGQ
jgi:uncharacterized protein YlxW (UPF0749 family)